MLIVLSPAKSMDFQSPVAMGDSSAPVFASEAALLVEGLRQLQPDQLGRLMNISPELAVSTAQRFLEWRERPCAANARPAIAAFSGAVYQAMRAGDFDQYELEFAQQHLRILSGLYGLLRPLDAIQPYRLEMGTRLRTDRGAKLYDFWGDRLADALCAEARKSGEHELVNLASQEYFRAIDRPSLGLQVITPLFKEWRGAELRMISFSAKRARGMMAAFAIRNRLRSAADLRRFDVDGYRFEAELSSEREWIFVRGAQQGREL